MTCLGRAHCHAHLLRSSANNNTSGNHFVVGDDYPAHTAGIAALAVLLLLRLILMLPRRLLPPGLLLQPSGNLCLGVKAKVVLGRHDAEGVGVTHTTSPSLHADDGVTLGQDAELDGIANTPLETLVDILLPWGGPEVGLLLVVVEWPHTTVKVGVAGSAGVAADHDDGADGAVLGHKAGSVSTKLAVSFFRNHAASNCSLQLTRW